MRLRNISLGLALGAGLLLAGCGGDDDKNDGLAVPPPPAPAPAQVGGSGAAMEAPSAPVVAPPPEGQAAAGLMPATPAPLKDDDLLGGNGRPLTEEEKMLINYGVSMFKEEKGRFPANLQEAVASRHITRLPKLPAGEEFNYDAQTGQVTVITK